MQMTDESISVLALEVSRHGKLRCRWLTRGPNDMSSRFRQILESNIISIDPKETGGTHHSIIIIAPALC